MRDNGSIQWQITASFYHRSLPQFVLQHLYSLRVPFECLGEVAVYFSLGETQYFNAGRNGMPLIQITRCNRTRSYNDCAVVQVQCLRGGDELVEDRAGMELYW